MDRVSGTVYVFKGFEALVFVAFVLFAFIVYITVEFPTLDSVGPSGCRCGDSAFLPKVMGSAILTNFSDSSCPSLDDLYARCFPF